MDTVYTVEGGVAIELKTLPDTMPCECCGDVLDFVSEDIGYSCRDRDCLMHAVGVRA